MEGVEGEGFTKLKHIFIFLCIRVFKATLKFNNLLHGMAGPTPLTLNENLELVRNNIFFQNVKKVLDFLTYSYLLYYKIYDV